MISTKHLTKTYPAQTGDNWRLSEINFEVDQGKVLGIIGRSGAGKSTLVRCLNLLERPDSGEVSIDGVDLLSLSPEGLRKARQRIGMIFQHFNLLDSATVFDNIALPLVLTHTPKATIRNRVEELLNLVGLSDKRNAYPADLSGGQKQRVAIARALAGEPKVLLSDEATSALDPETTASILALLKKINQQLNLTIVIVTHEMSVVKAICDHVLIMDQGSIVEQGGVINIFTQPKHEVTQSLTQSVMHLELPKAIKDKVKSEPFNTGSPVVRIAFIGESTKEALLAKLYEKYQVACNLLVADIAYIQETPVGLTICQLIGEEEKLKMALSYLEVQGMKVEVLGYA